MEWDLVKKVLAALELEGVRYAVVGAVAINLLGLARATEDLDFFIEPDRENVERLKAALRSVFADPSIEEISADDLLGDYPAVQYIPPEGTFHLDILTRLGEAFHFQDLEVVRVDLEGLAVSVVLSEHAPPHEERHGAAEGLGRRRGDQAAVPPGGELMPVRKFRNLQDMEDSLWREPGPELWRAIASVWRFADRTCPRRFPPGVYRHRSIEDAQRQREAWEEANFQALWKSRGIKPEELKGRKV